MSPRVPNRRDRIHLGQALVRPLTTLDDAMMRLMLLRHLRAGSFLASCLVVTATAQQGAETISSRTSESRAAPGAKHAAPEADPALIASMVQLLSSSDLDLRSGAATTLGRIGGPAVPSLVKALEEKGLRSGACEAIASIGPDAKDAIPPLAKLLGDSDVLVRMRAAIALGKIGPAAVPTLVKAIEDPDTRPCACTALGMVKPKDPAALQALLTVLDKKTDRLSACSAVLALAWMGPDAEPAVPKLLSLLADDKLVDLAKRRLGAGSAASLVQHTVEALGRIGPQASAAVPALNRLAEMRGSDEGIDPLRTKALDALGSIGPAANTALPELERSAADEKSPLIRQAALRALAALSPDSSDDPDLHRAALDHLDEAVRWRAAMALGRSGRASTADVERLVAVLRGDVSPRVRAEAATALGMIGKGSSRAQEALEEAAKNEDRRLRVRAKAALDALAQPSRR